MKLREDIFRAYDIRGIVGGGIDEDVIYHLGLAIGTLLIREGQHEVIVGRDARLSSPLLIKSLWQGFLDTGIDVIDIGEVPTPVAYYATYKLSATSAVILTASHNPGNYNGLKITVDRQSLSQEKIKALYYQILNNDFVKGQGKLRQEDIIESYFSTILNDIKLEKPLKVAIDCGNGITGKIARAFFEKLGCELFMLHETLDGNFPNHHPDPTVEENLKDLQEVVLRESADVGIAFDGDGDRLGLVTDLGEIIWADRLLMLYAQDVFRKHPAGTLLFDVKCTRLLPDYVSRLGGNPVMCKTGHSIIKQKINETGALLAGEMSGHIFFNDRWFGFDDGLYAAARLLEILAKDSKKLSQIFLEFPQYVNTPEIKIPLPEEKKFSFVETFKRQAKFDGGLITLIDGLRVDFLDGWGLVRSSNTSPCVTMRFEAENSQSLDRIQNLFREQLLAIDKSLSLPF